MRILKQYRRPPIEGWQRPYQFNIAEEFKILRSLNHESIVKVHDYFTGRKIDTPVMDYIPGGNLLEMLQHRRYLRADQFTKSELILF